MIENSTPRVYEDSTGFYNHNIWNRKNNLLRRIGIRIGQNVAIDSGFEWVIPGNISIGDNTAIGKNFKAYSYNKIIIGKFCMFAGEVSISNGTHDKITFIPSSGSIEIGSGCWIGHGVKIVGENISIGENSIIGAGSLVLSNIEPNTIVVGSPAKKIANRTPADAVWHLGNSYFSPKSFDFTEPME